MEKWALKKLLKKVDNFVSLVSLADTELNEIFKQGFSIFLGVEFSDEDFNSWLQKNSVFADKLALHWMLTGDQYGSFLETPFGKSDKEEYLVLRIYKSPPASKDDFKIKESALLQGTGAIPNLYYYKLIPFLYSGLETIDKKYSSYLFLAEGIQKILGVSIDSMFNTNFAKLVTNNSRLHTIMQLAETAPTVLGAGQDGVAFSIGPNRVLKIFKQKASLQQAINSIKRLHQSHELARTEAMIYDAGTLGVFGNVPIYFYIIEKMQTVFSMEDEDKESIHTIITTIKNSVLINQDYWDEVKESLMDPREHSNIKQKVVDNAGVISNHVRTTSGLNLTSLSKKLNLRAGWLELLCEEIIMKLLTGREDLHIGNLGVTSQGELRYFDPQFNFTPEVSAPQHDPDAPTMPPPPME